VAKSRTSGIALSVSKMSTTSNAIKACGDIVFSSSVGSFLPSRAKGEPPWLPAYILAFLQGLPSGGVWGGFASPNLPSGR
jgi:hypothetical protein